MQKSLVQESGGRYFVAATCGSRTFWFEIDPEDAERVAEHEWRLFNHRRPFTFLPPSPRRTRGKERLTRRRQDIADFLLGDHAPSCRWYTVDGNSLNCKKENFLHVDRSEDWKPLHALRRQRRSDPTADAAR